MTSLAVCSCTKCSENVLVNDAVPSSSVFCNHVTLTSHVASVIIVIVLLTYVAVASENIVHLIKSEISKTLEFSMCCHRVKHSS